MPADASRTIAALDALMKRVGASGAVAVKQAALAIQREGMSRTKVRSGTLRRSWRTEDVEVGGFGVYAARTGPTAIYARRIELGFKGTDSAGRTYNQAPSPYVRPAYDTMLPLVRSFFARTVAKAMRG